MINKALEKARPTLRDIVIGMYADEMTAKLLQSFGIPEHLIDQARKTHGTPPSGFTTAQLASILHQTAAANIPREIRAGYATVNVPKDVVEKGPFAALYNGSIKTDKRGKVVSVDPFNVTGMYDHAVGNTDMYSFTGKKPSTGVQTDDPMTTQVGGNHYKDMKIQPVEYAEANKLSPTEFAIVKYISRHKSKGGSEDVEKIIHFAEMLLKLQYGVTLPPRMTEAMEEHIYKKGYEIGHSNGYSEGREGINVETDDVWTTTGGEGPDAQPSSSTSASESNGKAPTKQPCPNCGSLDCPGSIEAGTLPSWFVYPKMPSGYVLAHTEIYRTNTPHKGTGRVTEYGILGYIRPDGGRLVLLCVVAYDARVNLYSQASETEIEQFASEQFKPDTAFRRSNSYTPQKPAITWFDDV